MKRKAIFYILIFIVCISTATAIRTWGNGLWGSGIWAGNTAPSNITSLSPENNSVVSTSTVNFNVTGFDVDADNLTFYRFLNNVPNGTGNATVNLTDGNYNLSWILSDGFFNITLNYTAFVVDTTAPIITIESNNFFNDDNTTFIFQNSTALFQLNFTVSDNHKVKDTSTNISCVGGFDISNFTQDWNITPVELIDKINLSEAPDGRCNVTIEASDALSNTPKLRNYTNRKPREDLVYYYDEEYDVNVSMLFELLNPIGNPLGLGGKDLQTSLTDIDGKHLKTSFDLKKLNDGQKIRLTYTSENNRPITYYGDVAGHFLVATNDKMHFKQFRHDDATDEGWTFELINTTTTSVSMLFYKADYGAGARTVLDPTTSGTNVGSKSYFFTLDSKPPSINLISPVDFQSLGQDKVDFTYNFTDSVNGDMCRLYINSLIIRTNFSITNNISQYFNSTPVSENIGQLWKVECNDTLGNIANSSEFIFDIIIPVSEGVGGGGISGTTGSRKEVPGSIICPEGQKLVAGIGCVPKIEKIIEITETMFGKILRKLAPDDVPIKDGICQDSETIINWNECGRRGIGETIKQAWFTRLVVYIVLFGNIIFLWLQRNKTP